MLAVVLSQAGIAQTTPTQPQAPPRAVQGHRPTYRSAQDSELCASCVRENLTHLAGPALHGRGSGTEDEHHAAEFIAGKLESYGLAPAAEAGQFIQKASVQSREVTGSPTVSIYDKGSDAKPLVFTHGKQIAISMLNNVPLSAPIEKLDLSGAGAPSMAISQGTALVVKVKAGATVEETRTLVEPYRNGKAALVILEASPAWQKTFDKLAKHPPEMSPSLGDHPDEVRAPLLLAKADAFNQLWSQNDGAVFTLRADVTPKTTKTWNVLAKIEGTTAKEQIVLLSAHLDHLGVMNGQTYYGADDDASGTVAVMELARALAKGPKPARTVIVALWGSEESGLVGARYFLQNPTFPLTDVIANLEFEMIGRPDPKLKQNELWLTGWDRTNLGPALAQHGAKLVGDPHPAEKFFSRSDNYALAKDGIVAQTVSSYGLHADYHQPTDTVANIDFRHMDQAIASMIGPVQWLANSGFKPEWAEGKKP